MKKFQILAGLIAAALLINVTPVFAAGFTITGNSTSAQTLSSGTGTVTATGVLAVGGTADAVKVTGTSSIVNSGVIEQTANGGGRAIRDNTGGLTLTITNNAGALIQAQDSDAIQMNKANSNVTLDNFGTINSINHSAGGAQAIDWNAITTGTNTLNNHSTGVLTAAEADAVRPGVNGVVLNDGLIKSVTTTGSSSDGIDAQTNSGISITNANTTGGALIEGGRHGITGGDTSGGVFTMSVTNNSGGTIQGDNGSGINIDGINANELVTIVNHGTITGNGHDIGDGATHDGDGVDVDGLVNLTNTGTIRSINSFGVGGTETSEGVTVGGGTIVNSGTIEGDVAAGNTTAVGRGITLAGVDKDSNGNPIPVQGIYANSTVTNSGLIKGQSDSGIAVLGPATGFTVTINNTATGTVEGGGTTVAALQTGADNDTVNNSGRIIADGSGKAIDLGAGNNKLTISGGSASITGSISGGTSTGTNSLIIDPGTGNHFSYAGSISNFSSAEVKSGTVTLSGASTYSGPTTLSGGMLLAMNTTGSATGSGLVTVDSLATLAGTGNIGGDVSVQSGGLIAPGNGGAGTLSLGGNLNLVDGSLFAFDLGPNAASSDLLVAGGELTFTGPGQALFDFTNNGVGLGSHTLLTFSGSSAGLDSTKFGFGSPHDGFDGHFVLDANSLSLVVTAIPEPSMTAAILGCFTLLGVAGWRTRLRKVSA
ncbi:MAG TPA: hypothetical protein VK717_03465 [Opitutaceae bacterium]|nr:hypothetical protein [Opitutaceae bacterium]